MQAAAAVMWLTFVVCLGIAVIGPRRWWRGAEAWKYKHPDANEPSEAAYGLQAFGTWGVTVITGVIAMILTVQGSHSLDADEVYSAAQSVASAYEQERGEGFLDPSLEGVADAAGYGDDLLFERRGDLRDDEGTEFYDVTNDEGDHPVCLTILADRGGVFDDDYLEDVSYEADVTPGACG